jgi:hypothetical protein
MRYSREKPGIIMKRYEHIKSLAVCCLAVASIAGLAGCGSGVSAGTQSGAAGVSDNIPDKYKLAGTCPSTVVVQMDWKPEAEYGAIWNLLGDDYHIDANKKETTGTLTIDGYKTGVNLTIRNVPSSQTAATIGYVNKDTLLTFINTDQTISAAASGQPYTSVVAPMRKSSQMIMWDPKTHPKVKNLKQLGETGTTILASAGTNWASLLEDQGIIKKSQIDTSYTGDPARFVSDPAIGQQGYSTSEPYLYEHEVQAWDKPVAYDMLSNYGYNIYPETYAVRSADLTKDSACLTKLVPVIQKSAVNYSKDGSKTIKRIVEAVEKYNDGWAYSEGLGNFSWKQLGKQGIIGNERGAAGGIDMTRVQHVLDTFGPILSSSGQAIPKNLTAADLATDKFIDKGIQFPES